MDTAFQDRGMLRAFGLVTKLLGSGVRVTWSIAPSKATTSSVDFTASATDVRTGAAISAHGYRGGPFLIDAADRATALPIVSAWLTANPSTSVHDASAAFAAPVARILVSAPSIAVLDTGNVEIIFSYLNAAGIPDATGNAWTVTSPGVLLPASVAGATATDHRDGALFDGAGQPVYTQLLAAQWGATRDATTAEVVAEIAAFLTHRTHVAVAAAAATLLEDSLAGHFLTTDNGAGEPAGPTSACLNGLCVASRPAAVSFAHAELPFAQLDGPFEPIGGSVPAYALAPGSSYRDPGVVIVRDAAVGADGVRDVWLTGYAGGTCRIAASRTETSACAAVGKVSYLGGHQYTVATPISANPSTQGTRLFLDSLLEAGSIAPPSSTP